VGASTLAERKIAAFIQDRKGPNRVGPWGLLQPLADGLKFFLKEDFTPAGVDRPIFFLATAMSFVIAMLGFAIIPWGGDLHLPWMPEGATVSTQVASLNVGILYILAVGSLSVYGIVLAGWASNNKYSFYGGMRAAAQMLSYEVPLGMAILVAVLTTGHLRLEEMVLAQAQTTWTVVYHPAAALILFVTALAESNRTPFDLTECEQELVGGYHTEYSALKHALFFLAEYAHMITASAFIIAMYFGGYLIPGWTWLNEGTSPWAMVARMSVFGTKVALMICLYMVVRWTLPRFRFDQLMRLAWTSLVPMTMAMVALQGVIVFTGWSQWLALPGNVAIVVAAAAVGAASGTPVTGRQQSLMRKETTT
jgi:NADH-quinone oxidoreductase subunit H